MPLFLYRDFPSIEVDTTADTKITLTFFRDQILFSLDGGVPTERFHCIKHIQEDY